MSLKESEIAERIREEHERIKQQMQKVNTMINAHVSQEGFPKWRLDLLWLLREFKNDLHKHFDLEEEGGFMNEVVKLAPQYLKAVRRLETEHEAMIIYLDEILIALKKLSQQDDMKLEAAEGNLIETTYLQDDGMAD
jgi:hypothetical protein